VILLGMFFLGLAMGDFRNVFMPPVDGPQNAVQKPLISIYNRWHFAGQFWIGIAAWPAIWQFYTPPSDEPKTGWQNFERAPVGPDEAKMNETLTRSDKSPDLGWVYTVVAGMLNILVIYDAVMGPAFVFGPKREDGPEGAAQ